MRPRSTIHYITSSALAQNTPQETGHLPSHVRWHPPYILCTANSHHQSSPSDTPTWSNQRHYHLRSPCLLACLQGWAQTSTSSPHPSLPCFPRLAFRPSPCFRNGETPSRYGILARHMACHSDTTNGRARGRSFKYHSNPGAVVLWYTVLLVLEQSGCSGRGLYSLPPRGTTHRVVHLKLLFHTSESRYEHDLQGRN